MCQSTRSIIIYHAISACLIGFAICAATIISDRIAVIANLTRICVDNVISTYFDLTVRVATVSGYRVSVVAGFSGFEICYAIPACLVGSAICAAMIAALNVAIVANLASDWIDDTVAAAADLDAGILMERAGLPTWAAAFEGFAEIGF